MTTGSFSKEMLKYFEAIEGAYTSFTEVEIRKGTFNVKSIIRNLLVNHLGRDHIPEAGSGDNQCIEFRVCEKGKIYHSGTLRIPCKFSKPDKEEMTIYFKREQMAPFRKGDYWYIYFKEHDDVPVIGIFSSTKWCDLFDNGKLNEMVEPDEKNNVKIAYAATASEMKIVEEVPPDANAVIRTSHNKTRKSVSVDEAAIMAHNRKTKG
ncbi:MAG: hypothetical protein NC124_20235, partial [Clostridium sp.]|nr:hypothetical protein [Clostridium sp.]